MPKKKKTQAEQEVQNFYSLPYSQSLPDNTQVVQPYQPQFAPINEGSMPVNIGRSVGPPSTPGNYNAGNIRDPKTGEFRSFATPQEGLQALVHQLSLYQTGKTRNPVKPTSTLLQAMSVYAPASDNNKPKKYAEYIAKQLGVSISTPIKDLDLNDWAGAIAQFEGNSSYLSAVKDEFAEGGNVPWLYQQQGQQQPFNYGSSQDYLGYANNPQQYNLGSMGATQAQAAPTSGISAGGTSNMSSGIQSVANTIGGIADTIGNVRKGIIIGGGQLLNNLIPEYHNERERTPQLAYNPNSYGTGSQAMAANGGTYPQPLGSPNPIFTTQVEDGKIKPISYSFAQIGGETHANGGTDVNNMGNVVEMQKGEPVANTSEGLVAFGKLKNPLTGHTYERDAKDLSKVENKATKNQNKASDLLKSNTSTPYTALDFNVGDILQDAANIRNNTVNQQKEQLAQQQQVQLDIADQLGLKPEKVSKILSQNMKSKKKFKKGGAVATSYDFNGNPINPQEQAQVPQVPTYYGNTALEVGSPNSPQTRGIGLYQQPQPQMQPISGAQPGFPITPPYQLPTAAQPQPIPQAQHNGISFEKVVDAQGSPTYAPIFTGNWTPQNARLALESLPAQYNNIPVERGQFQFTAQSQNQMNSNQPFSPYHEMKNGGNAGGQNPTLEDLKKEREGALIASRIGSVKDKKKFFNNIDDPEVRQYAKLYAERGASSALNQATGLYHQIYDMEGTSSMAPLRFVGDQIGGAIKAGANELFGTSFKNGGNAGKPPIHIKESHEGELTRKAKAHNMGVQEFAHYVKSHKKDFSKETYKQAVFAVNAKSWNKADNGTTVPNVDATRVQQPYMQPLDGIAAPQVNYNGWLGGTPQDTLQYNRGYMSGLATQPYDHTGYASIDGSNAGATVLSVINPQYRPAVQQNARAIISQTNGLMNPQPRYNPAVGMYDTTAPNIPSLQNPTPLPVNTEAFEEAYQNKPKKKNGGYVKGQTVDLTPQQIKDLESQGYKLEY